MIATVLTEHVLELAIFCFVVHGFLAANSCNFLTLNSFVLATILAVTLVVILFAAEAVVLVTRSGVLAGGTIVLINAHFTMCLEALITVKDKKILWIVVAGT